MDCWIGVGHPKDQAMIRSVELPVQPAFSGEGLEIELMIGHAYLMKPLQESPGYKILGVFWVDEHTEVPEE